MDYFVLINLHLNLCFRFCFLSCISKKILRVRLCNKEYRIQYDQMDEQKKQQKTNQQILHCRVLTSRSFSTMQFLSLASKTFTKSATVLPSCVKRHDDSLPRCNPLVITCITLGGICNRLTGVPCKFGS